MACTGAAARRVAAGSCTRSTCTYGYFRSSLLNAGALTSACRKCGSPMKVIMEMLILTSCMLLLVAYIVYKNVRRSKKLRKQNANSNEPSSPAAADRSANSTHGGKPHTERSISTTSAVTTMTTRSRSNRNERRSDQVVKRLALSHLQVIGLVRDLLSLVTYLLSLYHQIIYQLTKRIMSSYC